MQESPTRGDEWCRQRVRVELIKMRILTSFIYGVPIQNSFANAGFEGIEVSMTLALTLSKITPSESTTRKRRRPSAEALVTLAGFQALHEKRGRYK